MGWDKPSKPTATEEFINAQERNKIKVKKRTALLNKAKGLGLGTNVGAIKILENTELTEMEMYAALRAAGVPTATAHNLAHKKR